MQRFSLNHDTLPVAAALAISGCRCAVRTNATTVISSLRKWNTAKGIRGGSEFELMVLVDGELKRKATLPQFRGRGQYVFATFHGTELFIFDLRRLRVTAVVSTQTAQDCAFWTNVLIPIAMGVFGPMLGISPMHSACVEIGGRGMLIAGVSGAGKSTLATALAIEGMALVSDDWVYVAEANGRVIVHGLGVPVKLMPDAAEYFSELRGEVPLISLNGELAFEVDARKLGVEAAEQCEPECVVLLERVDGESKIAPLERAIARDFFERSAEPLPPEFAGAARRRKQIIHSVTDRDCWHFRYGGPPREGARILKTFFEDTYDVERASASAS